MMIYQQNMPTRDWSEEDLATVIAEAYVYQNYFNQNKWLIKLDGVINKVLIVYIFSISQLVLDLLIH